ncbi:hypothetical protein ACXEGC_005031 [Klebsiella pneumoniae]|uniref:hypothetical protein n=1 Tax=Klebsiella pneumoniae TaxID=573 RepID=UPI0007CBB7A4|nr:hypothetical protein [Klebsiella pneumoniae]SAT39274.1 phage EaA protein [Klebsiella pneumoniae]VAR84851.1 phage EaA protein [Klebsiella pneumoniae]VAR88666.1 phage EaA protein [Klebsiella pneumoniae]HBW8848826.1 hypothetical protein [Klebsiella pneumoniae]HCA9597109.1 hypothetical protein [Klebsiella pneumoniae]
MTTDITELAQMKGQKVEAPYYLAECTECGKMYPSSQLIESRNYMDGDADCYCPHCNATDPDIADCGSEGVTAWNYQQARIDALVEALEKAQTKAIEQGRTACELFDEVTALRQRIAELESRTVKLPDDEDGQAYGFGKWANGKIPATAGTMTIAYCEDAWRAALEVFSSTAGIKVEAE